MPAKRRKLGQAVTWRYVVALALVACLSAGAFIALYYTISQEENRGTVVRLVGLQQSTTQRIAYFANAYATATSAMDRDDYLRELGRNIRQFRRTHHSLMHAPETLELPGNITDRLHALFFDENNPFEGQVESFIANAEAVEASKPEHLDSGNARLLALNLAGMNYLPQGYDLISGILKDDGVRNIRYLKRFEIALLLSTLALLFLEAFLIFRPLARRVRRSVDDMEVAENAALTAAADAENSRRRLWSSIDTLKDGFAIYDSDDRLVIANTAYRNTQAPISELIRPGVRFEDLLRAGIERGVWDLGESDAEGWARERLDARSGRRGLEIEKNLADGRIIICREQHTVNGETVEAHFDATIARRRESELNHAKIQLEQLAYHDDLTGLGNRAACEKELSLRLQNAGPDDALCVIHFDIDRFKKVNDRMGHRAGDRLLREVGRRISILAEELAGARAFRWGGDEFVFVCCRNNNPDLDRICQDINDILSVPLAIDDVTVWPSASVGVARFPEDGRDLESLIAFADLALYEAKESGRDSYHFFTPELKDRVDNQKTIESELRKALTKGSLELFYQPQVGVDDDTVTGVECLLRWQHPEKGMLAPGEFLDIAEQSNLAIEIGRFVIEGACRAARQWLDRGVEFGHIAINISPKHLSLATFANDFINTLGRFELDPGHIAIEVVESVFIDDTRNSHTATLHTLYSQGIAVELDDFGTGFASLSHLTELPVSGIKIDKTFTDGLVNKNRKSDVVRAVVNLGKLLELRVVCEGVESEDQFNRLGQFRNVNAQGYFIAKPMGFDAMTDWLAGHRATSRSPAPLGAADQDRRIVGSGE